MKLEDIYQQYIAESSRRDFLKKLGGTVASSVMGIPTSKIMRYDISDGIKSYYSVIDGNMIPTLQQGVKTMLNTGVINNNIIKAGVIGDGEALWNIVYKNIMGILPQVSNGSKSNFISWIIQKFKDGHATDDDISKLEQYTSSDSYRSLFSYVVDHEFDVIYEDQLTYKTETGKYLLSLAEPGDIYYGNKLILSKDEAIKRGIFASEHDVRKNISTFFKDAIISQLKDLFTIKSFARKFFNDVGIDVDFLNNHNFVGDDWEPDSDIDSDIDSGTGNTNLQTDRDISDEITITLNRGVAQTLKQSLFNGLDQLKRDAAY